MAEGDVNWSLNIYIFFSLLFQVIFLKGSNTLSIQILNRNVA